MAAPSSTSSSPVANILIPSATSVTIRALIDEIKWGNNGQGTSATVYFSFPTTNANWLWHPVYVNNGLSEIYNNFNPATNAQREAARSALDKWSNVANIDFIEVSNEQTSAVGDIRIANTSGGGMTANTYAYAYFPNTHPTFGALGGDIWFNNQQPVASGNNYSVGAGGYFTMLHELGHALGLEHPFEGTATLGRNLDHFQYTVMSYSSSAGVFDNGQSQFYPTTPMLLDIQAIQFLYGANLSYNTGNDVYSFNDQFAYETIWDAGGNDTIQYTGAHDAIINLNAGTYSSIGPRFFRDDGTNAIPDDEQTLRNYIGTIVKGGITRTNIEVEKSSNSVNGNNATGNATTQTNNIGIAFNVTIENAIGGSGDDLIYGNRVNNVINGGDGNDTYVSSLNRSDIISIDETANGSFVITSNQDTDILTSIEQIQFADETLQLNDLLSQNVIAPTFETRSNGISARTTALKYNGPVDFLQYQLLGSALDEIVIGAQTNDFINLFGGNDAADGHGGDDVIDGGTGSNFLTGGTGADIFFIDGRSGQNTWSTITDFTNADVVNIWGWQAGISTILLQNENDGVDTYKGITLHMDLNADNLIDTSVTFTGLSAFDVSNRQGLTVADQSYLNIS